MRQLIPRLVVMASVFMAVSMFLLGCNSDSGTTEPTIAGRFGDQIYAPSSRHFALAYQAVLDEVQVRQKLQVSGISLTHLDGSLIVARVDLGEKQIGFIVSRFIRPNAEEYWKVDRTPLSSAIFASLLANKKIDATFKKMENDEAAADVGDRPDY